VRLWDSYFAESGPDERSTLHLFVCSAFLIHWKRLLLEQCDFQGFCLRNFYVTFFLLLKFFIFLPKRYLQKKYGRVRIPHQVQARIFVANFAYFFGQI